MEKLKPKDEHRAKVLALIKGSGSNPHDMAKRCDFNPTYLQQYIKYGNPYVLPENRRLTLATQLGVDERELREPWLEMPKNPVTLGSAGIGPSIQWEHQSKSQPIPVYGQAVAGEDGEIVLSGESARVIPHGRLGTITDAYAVYVVGESMEPRYFAGEVVYVNPRLPPRRGDWVVIQIAPKTEDGAICGYIKRLVKFDRQILRVEQLNPPQTREFPTNRVHSVHRIVGAGEPDYA